MGVAGANLLLLTLLCCLWQLVPGARARDWETVYCETNADSIEVAKAQETINNFNTQTPGYRPCCLDGVAKCSHYTSETVGDAYYSFGACGSTMHCDNCLWVAKMWQEVVDQCAVNYDGVDRVGGYVAYDWSPGIWVHYNIWKCHAPGVCSY